MIGEPFYTPREAAALLGVRPGQVRRLGEIGRLEVVRTPGGHRRYTVAPVEALRAAK